MKDKTPSNDDHIYKWVLLGFLWGAFFLQQGTRQIYNAIIPQIQLDFHVDSVKMGLVASAFTLMYGICVPFAGIASDMLRRKWMIVVGVFIFCSGIFASGFAMTIPFLMVSYGLCNGIGQSFYFSPASSLLGQYFEKMRSTAFSIHQTALYAGIVICSCVAGYLGELPPVAGIAGWKLPFLLFGGIGIIWAVVLGLAMRDTPQPRSKDTGEVHKASFKEALSEIFHRPSALILSISFGFMVYVDTGVKTWMPTYLYDTFGMTLSEAAFNSVIWMYAGAFIGVLFGSRWADKKANLGYKAVRFDTIIFGYAAASIFPVIIVFIPQTSLCFLALFVFGIFRGITDSSLFSSFIDVVPVRYRASGMGIMLCFGFVIGSTSSTVLGWMRDNFGLDWGIASLSAFFLTNAIIIFIARRLFFHKDFEEC